MKKTFFVPALVIACLLSACAAAAATPSTMQLAREDAMAPAAPAAPAATMAPAAPSTLNNNAKKDFNSGGQSEPQGQAATLPAPEGKRVLLLNASYTILVKDVQDAANKIINIASAKNGWVVNSNITQGGTYNPQGEKYYSGTISIRVPSEQLNQTRQEIEALAVEVTNRQLTGQDVTQQYADLQARMDNKKASAEQLRAMIADLRGAGYDTNKPEVVTAKVQALAQLADQLDRVQGEIDSMNGQLKYFNESAAYSIITITLQPYIPSQPIQIVGWHPEGVAKEAVQDLIDALEGLVNFLIRLGICGIPALLVLALFGSPFYFIGRAILRRIRRKPA
jgi:hypothetical protein